MIWVKFYDLQNRPLGMGGKKRKKEMGRRCGKKRKKKIGRRGSVRMCVAVDKKLKNLKVLLLSRKSK